MDVEEDQIGSESLGVRQRTRAVEGVDDGDALVFEREADEVDYVWLVIGDQDRQHNDLSGQARCQRRDSARERYLAAFREKRGRQRPAERASRPRRWAAYFTSIVPFMFGWRPQMYS